METMTAIERAAQYRTLNDARSVRANGQRYAVLALGETQIWYMKPEHFEWDLPDPANLGRTHILLGCVRGTHLEHIYQVMQGFNWSPNGEARNLIRKKGLRHTSMSVGDVVKCGEVAFVVDVVGFKELKPKKPKPETKTRTKI